MSTGIFQIPKVRYGSSSFCRWETTLSPGTANKQPSCLQGVRSGNFCHWKTSFAIESGKVHASWATVWGVLPANQTPLSKAAGQSRENRHARSRDKVTTVASFSVKQTGFETTEIRSDDGTGGVLPLGIGGVEGLLHASVR